jgi:hypothetical protein
MQRNTNLYKIKNKNNIKNKNKRRLANAQTRRRRNPMHLHIGSSTSALGSEYRYALLTGFIEGAFNNQTQYNLAQVFSSIESITVLRNWLYVKMLSVSVTYEPNNLNTSSRPLYMSLIWTNEEPSNLNLMNNVKIIPAFRIGFKSYTYKVPAIESSSLLLNKWKSPGDYTNSEFYLYLHSPGNTDQWYIRVDIKVILKGSKIFAGNKLVPKPEQIGKEYENLERKSIRSQSI